MTADRLRAAAKVLRERAKGAAEVADWHGESLVEYLGRVSPSEARILRLSADLRVGLALADWLDDEAGRIDMATEAGGDARPYEPAARLADLIIGGAS